MKRETFFGVKSIVDAKNCNNRMILIIIKNIKSFPHNIMNDLIHVMKKYREKPY